MDILFMCAAQMTFRPLAMLCVEVIFVSSLMYLILIFRSQVPNTLRPLQLPLNRHTVHCPFFMLLSRWVDLLLVAWVTYLTMVIRFLARTPR